MRAAIDPNTREATVEVVSEDEDLMALFEALDNLEGSLSKGSLLKRYSYSLPLQNKPKKLKTSSSILNVFSPKIQVKEKLCCIFPGAMMEIKPVINKIFKEKLATIVESNRMKKVFHDINVCAIAKNKSIKILVVKTKF